jgi:hypothetical protein
MELIDNEYTFPYCVFCTYIIVLVKQYKLMLPRDNIKKKIAKHLLLTRLINMYYYRLLLKKLSIILL